MDCRSNPRGKLAVVRASRQHESRPALASARALPLRAVKSSVHFRADFAPMAEAIIVAKAPGPIAIDHTELAYHKLRPGLRLMPQAA